MNAEKFYFLATTAIILIINELTFGQYFDTFEYYFPDQQLACQSQNYWTTWSSLPCDLVEDPYLSNSFSYSGTKSVKIVQNNDLVNLLDSLNFGYYGLSFWIYIPSGKSGYFNLLSGFTPNPPQWGMECYFDQGGGGRLINGGTVNFSWTPDSWHLIYIEVELFSDWAGFWINNVQVANWQWSRGGLIDLQLEAVDFFGATANDEMYIDDFIFWDGCLSCGPPNPPTNLTAIEIFDSEPKVKLNWQGSMFVYQFHIIRKDGYPNAPGSYEYIGTTLSNITEYIDSLVIVDQRYTYGVVAHGGYGYSDTSNFATILVVIPVELISFSYEINERNDVTLSWITATELNNKGFEILRLTHDDNEWTEIGFVPGKGTTTEISTYTFTDEYLNPGSYNYRIKQIDFDGSYKDYELGETVEIISPIGFELAQNYPNPFNPTTKIKFTIPQTDNPLQGRARGGLVILKVYGVLGNEITTLINEEKPAGEYEVEFDASGLTSGIYFYQLKAGSFIQTKKMVYLK